MRVSVTMNRRAVQQIIEAQKAALIMTAQEVLNEARNEQIMPMDTGNLQNESTFVDTTHVGSGIVIIANESPYAKKLYFHPEYHFNQSHNANAQGEWWNDWVEGTKKNRPKKLYREFYKICSGGYVK